MQKVVLPSEPVVLSGIPRAGGTPSKLRPSSTEKRASSASKLLGRDVSMRAQTPTELQRRSTSSRRVRRWENANMFGLEIHRNLIDEYMDDLNTDGKIFRKKYSAFNAESKTQFQAMLESNDQNLLDRFRKCEEELSSLRPKAPKISKIDADGISPSEKYDLVIESGLLSIERRARQVIMTKVASNLSLIEFVFELEQLIFDHIGLPASDESAASSIDDPIDAQYWSNLLQSLDIQSVNGNSLKIQFHANLSNVAFFRLLVHGVSQFHGVSSKSHTDPKSSMNKYMQLKKLKSKTRSVRDRTSLGAFLFVSLLDKLRDSDTTPINIPVYHAWEINQSTFRSLISDVRAKLMISIDTQQTTFAREVTGEDLCADFVMVDLTDFGVVDM